MAGYNKEGEKVEGAIDMAVLMSMALLYCPTHEKDSAKIFY